MKISRITKRVSFFISFFLAILIMPASAFAAEAAMNLTGYWAGTVSLVIFVLAYMLVIGEETIHLKKSKPVIVAAGLIWVLVAIAYAAHGDTHTAEVLVRHNLLEFAELFLFLLAAMTYINTMEERGIFDVLRAWL
ncbi:MAG: Na+/H+ antiporter NhaD/arsenite permease-like protein, partial [Lysobacterales bacterium]